MIEILFAPFKIFLLFPVLTLVPALLFAVHFWRRRAAWSGLAALAWALYAAWEISFLFRPVREWIRIDLLLIYPVLALVSIVALVSAYRSRASRA